MKSTGMMTLCHHTRVSMRAKSNPSTSCSANALTRPRAIQNLSDLLLRAMTMTLMTAMTMNTESAIMSHESRGWIGRRDHRHDMRRMSQVDQNRHARPDGAGKRDGLRGLGVGHEVLCDYEHDIDATNWPPAPKPTRNAKIAMARPHANVLLMPDPTSRPIVSWQIHAAQPIATKTTATMMVPLA